MCLWCGRSLIADRFTFASAPAGPTRRQFMAYATSVVAGVAVMKAGGPAHAAAEGAEVIFRNGTIIPMTAGPHAVEAIAIGGGKILAAGSAEQAAALEGSATRIVDLQGRTLLPGLIDPHHHAVLSALFDRFLLNIGYTGNANRNDALAALKAAVANTPAGAWVLGGFYDNVLQGGDLSMADLDAVSTDRPVFVLYVNGHVGAANSRAFDLAKITQDVGEIPGGGHFGRGGDGKLNGLIYEQPALLRFLDLAIPAITPTLIGKALADYAKVAAAGGNTTLHEPGTIQPAWVDGIAELSNTLPVRLSASFSTAAAEASKAYASLGPASKARRIPNSRMSLYGMKFWADGSNQAESAAQTEPYLNSSSQGHANYTVSQMADLCRTAKDAGWPILIHCQGDAAVGDAIDAIEQAFGANPPTGLNRIEHATMARQDQIARMKQLGIEPSFIPDFVYLYGAAYRDQIFGPERAEFMVPAGAAAQAGVPFTLHSDSPATGLPVNPLRHVQTAVTRRCSTDNSVVGAGVAVTLDQAMRAITINAARQIGLEDAIGSLEPGKEADLTILEGDPYKTDPEKLMAIRISETWVAGEKAFG